MIHIVQLLCPGRHCILALAFDPVVMSAEKAIELVEDAKKTFQVNPWCGLCGSTTLKYEHGPTRYQTMEEARPELERLQRENIVAMHQQVFPKN